jgi:hypothetical protein
MKTAQNPYVRTANTAQTRFRDTRTGGPAVDEHRMEKGAERTFASRRDESGDRYYEINAGSRRELISRIAQLQAQVASGAIVEKQDQDAASLRFAEFRSAYSDRSAEGQRKFQVVGEVMGEEIWETLGRQGFARKLLFTQRVDRGVVGQVKVRQKDVMAWQATSDSSVTASVIRQKYLYPKEFYLLARILIENKEIDQSSSDLLDEKYQDGLEQILRREDLILKALLDSAATVFNPLSLFTNFTPQVLSSMRTNVSRWGMPATTLMFSWDLWNDITADPDFVDWFDQISKHELVLEGKLG